MIHNSYYRVQRHLSIHPSISNINTYEDNDDGLTAGHSGRFGQVEWIFLLPDAFLLAFVSPHSLYTA
jgi:hypothetical protein